jgi:hypothetical protein
MAGHLPDGEGDVFQAGLLTHDEQVAGSID